MNEPPVHRGRSRSRRWLLRAKPGRALSLRPQGAGAPPRPQGADAPLPPQGAVAPLPPQGAGAGAPREAGPTRPQGAGPTPNPLRRVLGPLVGLCLLGASLWVLHRLLAEFQLADIVAALRRLSPERLLAALGLTALGYGMLGFYDVLAVRYVRQPVPWGRAGIAGMVSCALSNSIGMSVLTSGSVRYRFYAGWGLSPPDIARIVGFSTLTLWFGILSAAGAMLLWAAPPLPGLPRPVDSRLLGLLLLIPPLLYAGLSLSRRPSLRVRGVKLAVPTPGLMLAQLCVGSLDWGLAGAVLFVLLPPGSGLGLAPFLTHYLVAQGAALVSHVPGGLGVFESAVLWLLPGRISGADAFGALIVYRLVYYLLPLALAALALGLHELSSRRRKGADSAEDSGS